MRRPERRQEYETLNLTDYKIYGYGQEYEDDQFMEVIDKIREANVIVMGSPLYWHNLSGLMRCFLDRTYGPFEQGEFLGRDISSATIFFDKVMEKI